MSAIYDQAREIFLSTPSGYAMAVHAGLVIHVGHEMHDKERKAIAAVTKLAGREAMRLEQQEVWLAGKTKP